MNSNNGVTYQGMFNTTDVNADSINTDDITCDTIEVSGQATIYDLTITNNLIINNAVNLTSSLAITGAGNTDKFDVYMPDGVTKLINANTASGGFVTIDGYFAVATGSELYGPTLIDNGLTLGYLSANELLQSDGSLNVISSNTLPSGCTIPHPSITNLTASSLIQTDSSGNMIESNNISENITFTAVSGYGVPRLVIEDGSGSEAFSVETNSSGGAPSQVHFNCDVYLPTQTINSLLQCDSSNFLRSSNTLPSGCSASSMTLTNPTLSGTIATSLAHNDLVTTDGSGNLSTTSTTGLTLTNTTLSGTTTLSGNITPSTNFYDIGSTSNYLTGLYSTFLVLPFSSSIAHQLYASSIALVMTSNYGSNAGFVPFNDTYYSLGTPAYRWGKINTTNISDDGTNVKIATTSASQIVQTNSLNQITSSNTLPSGCTIPSPTFSGTITTPLTASSIIQTNGSSQLIASNALPFGTTCSGLTLGATSASSNIIPLIVENLGASGGVWIEYVVNGGGGGNIYYDKIPANGTRSFTGYNYSFYPTTDNTTTFGVYNASGGSQVFLVDTYTPAITMNAKTVIPSGQVLQLQQSGYGNVNLSGSNDITGTGGLTINNPLSTSASNLNIIPGYKAGTATSGYVTYDIPSTGTHYFWDNVEVSVNLTVDGSLYCTSNLDFTGSTPNIQTVANTPLVIDTLSNNGTNNILSLKNGDPTASFGCGLYMYHSNGNYGRVNVGTTGVYQITSNNTTTGVALNPSATSWTSVSTRKLKTIIDDKIDHERNCELLDLIPVDRWHYTASETKRQYIGPYAEEIKEYFNLYDVDEKGHLGLSTQDFDGILFSCLKGLYAKNKKLSDRIDKLEQMIYNK
jgi:hypothetical protein